MKIKKFGLLVTFALVALLSIVSCGKKEEVTDEKTVTEENIFADQETFNSHMEKLYDELFQYQTMMSKSYQDDFSETEWRNMSDKGMEMEEELRKLEEEASKKRLKPYYIVEKERKSTELLNSPEKMIEYLEQSEYITNGILEEKLSEEDEQIYRERLEMYSKLKEKINNELIEDVDTGKMNKEVHQEIKDEFNELFGVKEQYN